jgi:tRNA(fMet)-specific endonuclease VapC
MYFLGSNTCIYFLKGLYPSILEALKTKNPKDIKIPAIVKAELLTGIEKSEQKAANKVAYERFLAPFEIVSFDNESAIIYSKIRATLEKKGKIIGPNDLIIASVVLANNGILVTHNVKEFKQVPTLRIEDWVTA